MPKTVLHIAEAPGGVERYLVSLFRGLKDNNEFEHVLVCSDTFDEEKFRDLVKEVIVVKNMHNRISIFHDSKAIVSIRKIIKRINPDYVYCHSSKAGAIGRIADGGLGHTRIYNAHGWSFNRRTEGKLRLKLYEIIERALAHMTDIIVCVSEYERVSALKHRICSSNKLIVINNGIDFREFENIIPKSRRELGIPDKALVVGMVGRLTNQKAPDVFIKMARLVKEQIPNSFFVLIGDDIGNGKCREEIEELIEKYELSESVLITGWVNNPLEYISVIDLACLFSRWEGFGLVLLEYMNMGKPIVATRVDAVPYIVGNAGILVDVNDFIRASESIIALWKSAELRDRLARIGKERCKQFDIERTINEHFLLFRTFKY